MIPRTSARSVTRTSTATGRGCCGSSSRAVTMTEPAAPLHPDVHLIDSGAGRHLFLPNGSRLYDVDEATYTLLDGLRRAGDDTALAAALSGLGVDAAPYVDDAPLTEAPVRALSLAVAQKCNLGCTYCYADGGSFVGPVADMPLVTALASVYLLFCDVGLGERVNLAFFRREPV